MESIKDEYRIPIQFYKKMENMSFNTFRDTFVLYDDDGEDITNEKKLRNDHSNRMKKTNLMIYFMDYHNAGLDVTISNLKLQIIKLEQQVKELKDIKDKNTLNAIGFVVNECH